MVLFSISYWLVRWMLGLSAMLMRRDLSKDAELLVLRHENTALHRQVARVRYRPVDQVGLTSSRLVPRRRWTDLPGHSRRVDHRKSDHDGWCRANQR
jgi:hypothetical protein